MKRCHREVNKALRFALGFSARPSGVSWLYTDPQHHHFAGVIRYSVVQGVCQSNIKKPILCRPFSLAITSPPPVSPSFSPTK
jgi:hypothetical protein